ncbi:MAG: Protein-L-isoaspartate O-methyltransferase [Alphaproteobacteria bacterium MarineAlpha5_Bin9]|nr:MAG: Protein-L-isoaspartate O-methyltransferase [Alphaproteobacteria bacterium MarineAlpha5_Bin9]|tara:strand:- start:2121 stop:2777 length:657 start_codon:yes stop_codon:yes gene_type:complete
MNFKEQRSFMVENQLRPNKINNLHIINLFNTLEKESFLKNYTLSNIYSDNEILLKDHRGYLKNLHIAQLLQNSNITKDDKVLHIGGLTGYVSVLISKLCKNLIVIENNIDFLNIMKNNVKNEKIENILIYENDLKSGYNKHSPYDLIFIDCPVYNFDKTLLFEQINSDNGRIIMIDKINENICKAVKITKIKQNFNKEFLFDVFSKFLLYQEKEQFVF